ncbi:unnamed protein product [Dicrocoelium dendriticum]|nr:unnamed protein product [Dicrocoelium dendriticum]
MLSAVYSLYSLWCFFPFQLQQQLIDFEKSEKLATLREKLFSVHGEWPPERRLADSEALRAALAAEEYFLLHKVYPDETSLCADTASDHSVSMKEGDAVVKDIKTPIHRLNSSFYTVHCQGKPIQLSEFLSTRAPPPVDEPPNDESSSSSQ